MSQARNNQNAEQSQEPAEGQVPFSIAHDNRAGVKLYKFARFKQMQLQFEQPLPPALAEKLYDQGWKYREGEGVYTKQFGEQGLAAAVIEAKRLYAELVKALAPEREVSF